MRAAKYQSIALLRTGLVIGAVATLYHAILWMIGEQSNLTEDYWAGLTLGYWAVHACNRERFEP